MAKQCTTSHVMPSVLLSSPLFALLNFMDLLKWYNPERFLFLKKKRQKYFSSIYLATGIWSESQRSGQLTAADIYMRL